ncbi:hypothetical protein DB032_08860 [Chromobacterium sp. Panama]|uniref:DUF1120 domain-containing protein n=1 Tax=Chromobacterium sp. Panama TaxID=2161826 RepID=UPI000D2F8650|nr:DUF1120 domain-containing protein [Chromobacterium sp. Panama]PTU65026.1 hypothetical protein DB032_08860 [Chromobacterium sp. Panama]
MKMNYFLCAGFISASGLAVAQGGLAGSAQFEVKGRIVPSACVVNVNSSSGKTFDYPDILAKDLKKDEHHRVARNTVKPIEIVCEAPTAVSWRFVDNRAESVSVSGAENFGLGSSNGQFIGYHKLNISNTKGILKNDKGDVASFVTAESADNKSWVQAASKIVKSDAYYTVYDDVKKAPIPFVSYVVSYGNEVNISPTSKLDVKDVVEFDGLVTMDVHYI